MAARQASARRGIYRLFLADSRHHAATCSGRVRARLPPVHDSRGRSRCARSAALAAKNRKRGVLSGAAALAAAVRLPWIQARRLSKRGTRGARSVIAADVPGVAERGSEARGGNGGGGREKGRTPAQG